MIMMGNVQDPLAAASYLPPPPGIIVVDSTPGQLAGVAVFLLCGRVQRIKASSWSRSKTAVGKWNFILSERDARRNIGLAIWLA